MKYYPRLISNVGVHVKVPATHADPVATPGSISLELKYDSADSVVPGFEDVGTICSATGCVEILENESDYDTQDLQDAVDELEALLDAGDFAAEFLDGAYVAISDANTTLQIPPADAVGQPFKFAVCAAIRTLKFWIDRAHKYEVTYQIVPAIPAEMWGTGHYGTSAFMTVPFYQAYMAPGYTSYGSANIPLGVNYFENFTFGKKSFAEIEALYPVVQQFVEGIVGPEGATLEIANSAPDPDDLTVKLGHANTFYGQVFSFTDPEGRVHKFKQMVPSGWVSQFIAKPQPSYAVVATEGNSEVRLPMFLVQETSNGVPELWQPRVLDTTELNQKISDINALDPLDFMKQQWDDLENYLGFVNAEIDSPILQQDQVDAMLNSIERLESSLVPISSARYGLRLSYPSLKNILIQENVNSSDPNGITCDREIPADAFDGMNEPGEIVSDLTFDELVDFLESFQTRTEFYEGETLTLKRGNSPAVTYTNVGFGTWVSGMGVSPREYLFGKEELRSALRGGAYNTLITPCVFSYEENGETKFTDSIAGRYTSSGSGGTFNSQFELTFTDYRVIFS